MARICLAIFVAALVVGLSPVGARAQFDPTFDAHRVVQAEAQARIDKRAAADAAGAGRPWTRSMSRPSASGWTLRAPDGAA
jgi:hypothetical protein